VGYSDIFVGDGALDIPLQWMKAVLYGDMRLLTDAQTRKRGRPYRVGAPVFHKSNIGDFSGSRWPLKNGGSYSTVSVLTENFLPPTMERGRDFPILAEQSL
jgi:hypothetical protein